MIRLMVATRKRCIASLCLIFILIPFSLHAECQVSLTWDPNTPNPTGYRLYQREADTQFNYEISTDVGQNTTYTVSGLTEGTTYHFVVRAYLGADESGNSNEATYFCNSSGAGASSNPPRQPLLLAPSHNTPDVSLQPTLTTSAFIDHDAGDYHAQTRWMVYRLDDDACVLDTTSASALTSFTIPSSILSPFTTYYWTACYFDQNGSMSTPAQTSDFTTQQAAEQDPEHGPSASLSTSTSSGGGSGGGGGGCFIQTLLETR